jgi:glycosyltransferase involved in cell wall biosynthesis
VKFTGSLPQTELTQLYRRCSVYVQPTLCEEAFGMPVVEAMACGAPVVATRRGGIPEIIESGQSGLLVPSGDSRVLAAELDRLLADEPLRGQLAARGCQVAQERFAWSHSAAALADVLNATP